MADEEIWWDNKIYTEKEAIAIRDWRRIGHTEGIWEGRIQGFLFGGFFVIVFINLVRGGF